MEMDLGTSITILALALFLPLLFSIIFLLFRLSSRFGYSFITLRSPLSAVVVTVVHPVLVFVLLGSFGNGFLFWGCGVSSLAIIVLWVVDSRYLRNLAKKRKTIVKKLGTSRRVVKIIARIVLVIVLGFVAVVSLASLWTVVTNPIFDKLDQDKFATLDTQMRGVYQNLKTASGGEDDWKYRTACYDTNQNWLSPPDYLCEATISFKKTVTSLDGLNRLQEKYYPVINTDNRLKPSPVGLKTAFGFGGSFIVSLAYSEYVDKKTNIGCTYEINLYQIEKNINYQTNNDDPGSAISNGQGGLYISFRCDETARSPWYQQVQDTSNLMPE